MTIMASEIAEAVAQGDRLRDCGQLHAAASHFRCLLDQDPGVSEYWYKLGVVLERLEEKSDAEIAYRKSLTLRPAYPEAASNLGLMLAARGEPGEAERLYRQALADCPDFYQAHINLGNLAVSFGRMLEATYLFRRAIALRPDAAAGRDLLGCALRGLGKCTEALQEVKKSIELDGERSSAWANLGVCHYLLGNMDDAAAAYSRALELQPDFIIAWNNLLHASNYRLLPRDAVLELYQTFARMIENKIAPDARAPHSRVIGKDGKIRVGFVSGDLRRHSVSYFVEGALRSVDRNQFELFAYFNGVADERSEELCAYFDHWTEIRWLADDAVVDLMRENEIDVLFDLSGHTAGNRLGVFARRAAPVQVSWIGYPNTTGIRSMDYRLGDSLADPDGDDYLERLVDLGGPFLCYSPPSVAPAVEAAPCLRRGYVTFGSFSTRCKLGEYTSALWAKVMQAVPESRLLLKAVIGLDEPEAREQLLRQMAILGVASERIEIRLSDPSHAGHFRAYQDVDIALDTFPYCGTTTICEALWMGVPVVSLSGDRHVSRVGVSLLTHAGHPEWIAGNDLEYVEIASGLAADFRKLSAIREHLREQLRSSALLDSVSMGKRLEDAIKRMIKNRETEFDIQSAERKSLPHESKTGDRMKLHIGGQEVREGWTILDAMSRAEVDIVGDVRDMSPFADESCAEIYASHVIEHIGQQDMVDVLKGLHRVLQPGGKLYLSVPDLDVLTWLIQYPRLEVMDRFHIMRIMYGGQVDHHDFHLIGLNFDFLVDYLRQAGFFSVEQVESFGLFDDTSELKVFGFPISVNVIAEK